MTDRLEQVPYAIGLSRRILGVVRQNVVFAVGIVVLLVIANGMRLIGGRAHQPSAGVLRSAGEQ
jgi:cation transport ATPase